MLKKSLLIASSFSILSAFAVGTCSAEGSRLDQMISPVTNSVQFEDPRPFSEVRPIFMYHKTPSGFVTGSGDVRLYAAQARLALSDRLAIIATKDGYIDLNPDINLDDSDGSANLAGGLKYAVHRDDEAGSILSLGLRYEAATGSPEVFQGVGDGMINPFVSGAIALESVNLMGMTQLRLPIDDEDSTFWDMAFHVDVPMGDFYPLFEVNMVHVVDAGNRIGLAGEGFDLVNFGSSATDGKTTVTAGVGARYRILEFLDVGAAYEVALTDNDDIFDWRVTTDLSVRLPNF